MYKRILPEKCQKVKTTRRIVDVIRITRPDPRGYPQVIHVIHITPLFHAQVIHVMYLTIPFVRNVRFVPLKMSDPPVILTSIKKVRKGF